MSPQLHGCYTLVFLVVCDFTKKRSPFQSFVNKTLYVLISIPILNQNTGPNNVSIRPQDEES